MFSFGRLCWYCYPKFPTLNYPSFCFGLVRLILDPNVSTRGWIFDLMNYPSFMILMCIPHRFVFIVRFELQVSEAVADISGQFLTRYLPLSPLWACCQSHLDNLSSCSGFRWGKHTTPVSPRRINSGSLEWKAGIPVSETHLVSLVLKRSIAIQITRFIEPNNWWRLPEFLRY